MEPDITVLDHRGFAPPLAWSAIFAGALTAIAVSVLLTILAAGFGINLGYGGVASRGALAVFTPMYGAYAIAAQVISGELGGYVAGRLRHAWPTAHLDEAHFRDTAHGLIAWALATIVGAVLGLVLFGPHVEAIAPATAPLAAADTVRAGNILAQASLFTALGMLLAAFTAAVAARVGGMRTEEMHVKPRG